MRVILVTAALLALSGCAREMQVMKGQELVEMGALAGGPWRVEDVNGGGVIDDARLDMTFDVTELKISGHAGCNSFWGSFVETGPVVKIGPLATTRKMCAPALMDLEAKLLSALEASTSVTYDKTGAATLRTPDGRRIKIRKEP
jgi:heat shock protein HslJ